MNKILIIIGILISAAILVLIPVICTLSYVYGNDPLEFIFTLLTLLEYFIFICIFISTSLEDLR